MSKYKYTTLSEDIYFDNTTELELSAEVDVGNTQEEFEFLFKLGYLYNGELYEQDSRKIHISKTEALRLAMYIISVYDEFHDEYGHCLSSGEIIERLNLAQNLKEDN